MSLFFIVILTNMNKQEFASIRYFKEKAAKAAANVHLIT